MKSNLSAKRPCWLCVAEFSVREICRSSSIDVDSSHRASDREKRVLTSEPRNSLDHFQGIMKELAVAPPTCQIDIEEHDE